MVSDIPVGGPARTAPSASAKPGTRRTAHVMKTRIIHGFPKGGLIRHQGRDEAFAPGPFQIEQPCCANALSSTHRSNGRRGGRSICREEFVECDTYERQMLRPYPQSTIQNR